MGKEGFTEWRADVEVTGAEVRRKVTLTQMTGQGCLLSPCPGILSWGPALFFCGDPSPAPRAPHPARLPPHSGPTSPP